MFNIRRTSSKTQISLFTISQLKETGLKVNANKSHFAVSEIEYLGYWITRNGIQPVPKKVEATQRIAPPTTRKQVRSFIGLINYY
jgi:putative transposase